MSFTEQNLRFFNSQTLQFSFPSKRPKFVQKRSNTRSLNSTTIFRQTYAKIGRNVSKPLDFHPRRRLNYIYGSNFNQIEQNSTKNGHFDGKQNTIVYYTKLAQKTRDPAYFTHTEKVGEKKNFFYFVK
jgi:hypothetical protein